MRVMAIKESYHHGALRMALLDAALGLLEADGLDQLSLRKVATKVGVSHAAPAHHFPSLRHLLTALATIGFQRFDASMRSARMLASADPATQMRAAEAGYLAFSKESPALFRLMFTANLLDWSDPNLQVAARASRLQLSEVCAPAAAHQGLKSEQERMALEHMVWSQIHGQAHLMMDRKFSEDDCTASEPRSRGPLDLAALLFR
jgi:AcrR family transcriptional regulator